MTAQPLTRRSLQTRLTLAYATGSYAAGVVVLLAVLVPLTGAQSVTPEGRPGPGVITGTGSGLSLPETLTAAAAAVVVLIPVALALGWFVAGRFLRPLRAITATAKVISTSDLHQRLDLGEPTDELTELGQTLDDLFARLQASFDAQRHFVANASHELRTPLAGLRTLLEVALADPAADAQTLRTVCREALALGEHQERIVEALLVLATSERGTSRRDPIDLSQVVERVLETRHQQATQRGIHVDVDLSSTPTAGDPRLIESLVANLIDNAIRHNHPNGHVTVTTRTLADQATLTVANTGPPVPAAEVQSLFAPFHKRSAHSEGHGLGLAIVKAVTQAHQATLTTTPHPQGGLTITTHFPQPHPTDQPPLHTPRSAHAGGPPLSRRPT
ncbi:sensor histidine kinase [Kribbella sp. NPDC020789]